MDKPFAGYNLDMKMSKKQMTSASSVFVFLVFSALCISLVMFHFSTLGNPKLEILGEGELRIHSRQQISSPYVLRTYQTALGFTHVASHYNAKSLRAKFDVIDGESFTLARMIDVREILAVLGHRIVERQENHIMSVTYAYSGRARDFIMSGRNRVNLQIAVRGDRVTVGWPVILGSF